MLSAVGIQEASSNPKPRAPRRSGRPTLTRRAFSVAIPAPRKTPRIPTYGLVVDCGRPDCGGVACAPLGLGGGHRESLRHWPAPLRTNRCDHGQPGPQSLGHCLAGIQHDLHGYSLHDLCEVAGRIVGRQQRELRAAGRRHLIDFPSENHSRKRVHADFSRVARADVADLRFFVIGLHPNVALNERNYLSAWTDQLSGAHLAFADDSVFRRYDSRVTQIDSRQCERGSLRIQIGAKQKFLRIEHGTLALLRFEFGLCAPKPGVRSGQIGLAAGQLRRRGIEVSLAAGELCAKALLVRHHLLQFLARRGFGRNQRFLPPPLQARALHVRFGSRRFRCAHWRSRISPPRSRPPPPRCPLLPRGCRRPPERCGRLAIPSAADC